MKKLLLPSFVGAALGVGVTLAPAAAQTSQQCVYETTADGPISAANIRKVSGPGSCATTPASGTDFYLYVIHNVTLTGSLAVGGTSGGTSGKLIVGRTALGVADAGSLSEPTGQNYTLTIQSNQQSDIGLDVAGGGIISVNNLVINKVDAVIQTNGVVNTECNAALSNNTDLTINGRLNVQGNLDLTGSSGGTQISGSGMSAGNGLRVQGNIYGSNNTVNSYFTTDGSGNPTLTVCVQGLAAAGCATPVGNVASGTNNDPNCVSRVLPITLRSFHGAWRQNGRVLALTWLTASEKNNATFIVERSADGAAFTRLREVNGAGNSTSLRSYSITDDAPLAQLAYYRLKQVDYDGTTAISAIIPVQPLAPGGADWLLATSTPQQMRVVAPQSTGGQLQVLDMMGRVVFSQQLSTDHSLVTLPTMPAGVYVYRLTTPAGKLTQRLVQQ